jgi:O-antigen ligase/tetratricopeptide (TPR) repeat protein
MGCPWFAILSQPVMLDSRDPKLVFADLPDIAILRARIVISCSLPLRRASITMSHGSKRTKTSRPDSSAIEFGTKSAISSQPLLVTATDVCLWSTMFAVAIGFGGRMAGGQLALVIGASITVFCWLLHQLTSAESRYSWNGSEWVWAAGILVALSQIIFLPTDLLLTISPQIKEILPLWFDKETASLFPTGWHQLSLAPWETASGLATFTSYALLFGVACQRIRTIRDIELTLCQIALAAAAMMAFAQMQFLASNGKFFWYYDHPFMKTDTYPLGCFTNRNHLAQFLALGTAPLLWWLLRRLQQQQLDQASRRGMPPGLHAICVVLLLSSLAGIALTVLMTLSRGGLLAVALTSCISIGLLCRTGLASVKFGMALLIVGMATSGLFSLSKYESVLAGRLKQDSGRSEIWQANIQVARDFPLLGTGVGTHNDAYQLHIDSNTEDGFEYTHAECGYLQVASESGLFGLTVAALFIVTSFWWCLGSLWNVDTKASSAAATILASLIANVSHAVGDFFWYTPSCMLLLAMQLACAARLYRLTRQAAGRSSLSFRIPRFVTATAMCGLIALAAWMFDLKHPALQAEIHRMQEVRLANTDITDFTEEEKEAALQQRLKEVVLAAKVNPRDAKLQEAACIAYLQLFDIRQQHADNTMSLAMLRDAVRGSESLFETAKAKTEWLDRAIGANLKLLRLARRSLTRSLANCPLRSKSYVLLSDLNFLNSHDSDDFNQKCLGQSLRLRPGDPDTLYLVGNSELQNGKVEQALVYWRPAFQRSPRMQERIAGILTNQMSPEQFQQEFQPDAKGLEVIAQGFKKAGRLDEAQQTQRLFIDEGLKHARSLTSDEELEATLISVRNTCVELGDIDAAVNVLSYAVERLPHNYSIHYMLGLDLMTADRIPEASEHLQWCSNRQPGDVNLRKLTSRAVIERLKQTPSTGLNDANVEQFE